MSIQLLLWRKTFHFCYFFRTNVFIAASLSNLVFVLRMPSFFNPSEFEIIETNSFLFDSSVTLKRKNGQASDFILVFVGVFQGFASLQIIASWLDLLTKLTNVFPERDPLFLFTPDKVKKIISIFSIVLIITLLFLASFSLLDEVSLIFILMAFTLAVCYIVAFTRFKHKVDTFLPSSRTKSANNALKLVTRSFTISLVCLVGLVFFSCLGFSGVLVYKRTLRVGGFNYWLFFLDIAFIFGMILMTYTSYYVHKVTCRIIKTSKRIAWVPGFDNYLKKRQNTQLKVDNSLLSDEATLSARL